jgi:GT2 family glycosyltransferase
MQLPLVVVVTVNWNRREDTLACLETLAGLTYLNRRFVVVDNGSTDGSAAAIKYKYPDIEQISSERNLGFAGGFNIGLRRALELGAAYVLILNNDTLAPPGLLEPLVAAASAPDVGVTAPIIVYAGDPTQIWSAGAGRNHITLELTGNHGRSDRLLAIVSREFVSGCAMLIKRSVLQQVGLLDERFFMYYEDSDYCLRLRQAGYKLLVVPAVCLRHKVSRSTDGSDSLSERYWMGRSSALFFRKHVRGWRWVPVLLWRIGSTLKTTARLLLAGRANSARAYLRGVTDGWRSRILNPRRGSQS